MTLSKPGISALPSMRPNWLHPIERMLASGELPIERDCVQCGRETGESLSCVVQCETKGGRLLDLFPKPILFLFAPIWFVPFMRRSMETSNTSAEDKFIRLKIRLCDQCKNDIQLTPQNLRILACKTPVIADLFAEFPNARIQGKRTSSSPVPATSSHTDVPSQDATSRTAFCSTCKKDVAIDDDERCVQCRWPV